MGDRTTTQRPPPTALGPVPVPRACVSKALRLIFRAACRPGLRAGPCASWGWYSAALRGSLQEVHSPAVARRAVAQTTPPPPRTMPVGARGSVTAAVNLVGRLAGLRSARGSVCLMRAPEKKVLLSAQPFVFLFNYFSSAFSANDLFLSDSFKAGDRAARPSPRCKVFLTSPETVTERGT